MRYRLIHYSEGCGHHSKMVKAPDGNFVPTRDYERLLQLTKAYIDLTDAIGNLSEFARIEEVVLLARKVAICKKTLLNIIAKDNRI